MVVLGDDERVDFQHRRIEFLEGAVAAHERVDRRLHLRGLEAQREGDLAGLEGLHADGGFHADLDDRFGLLRRDLLDLHAALRRGNDHHALGLPVQHEAQIELLGDGDPAFDIETAHDLAGGAGLVRDQLLAQQVVSGFHHLVFRATELDATSLAAATSVHLRLDDPQLAADFTRAVGCLFGAVGESALGGRYAEAGQDFLGLIFMNVHVCLLRPRS